MQARSRVALKNLFRSYLFLPLAMALGGAGLAIGLVALDHALLEGDPVPVLYTGGPEGAAGLLSAVASATITVGGVVFSVTMVTLSLTMSQFGPRLLPTFLANRANQVVLGVFVATFVYSLLVLRTVRRDDGSEFVPHVATSVAILLAVASVVFLIYFLHNVSTSIQVGNVTIRAWKELRDRLEEAFPEPRNGPREAEVPDLPAGFSDDSRPIESDETGYLQTIDLDGLLKTAVERDVVIRVDVHPGLFIQAGTPLAHAGPSDRVDGTLEQAIQGAFSVNSERTSLQDPEFILEKLGQLALRALSPSLNDPFTAITCIDWMAAALSYVAARDLPSAGRRDEDGRVRVVGVPFSFGRLAAAVFDPLRPSASTQTAVAEHLFGAIARIAGRARREGDRAVLREHVGLLEHEALEHAKHEHDRRRLEAAAERTKAALAGALVSSARP